MTEEQEILYADKPNKSKEMFDTSIDKMQTIILAIETKSSIAFNYTKDVVYSGVRTILPHNLYWNKDDTKVMLDGFQIAGESKSENVQVFKQFDTLHIKNVIILNDSFEIQKGYNAESERYFKSVCGVEKW